MKRTNGCVTPFYALVHALYWVTNGLMFSYASVFLLDRGFSNGEIGAILGLSYALSACIQPPFAVLVSRLGVRLSSAAACVYAAVMPLSLALFLAPLQGLKLAATLVAALTLQSSLQPTINSLHRGYELNGVPVNFSLARGVGSAAFSLMSFLMGMVLRRTAPSILPACYFSTQLALAICLILFRAPSFASGAAREARTARPPLLRRHPRFALFLAGLVCLSLAHMFIDNFMLQIMRSVGGDSAGLGTAIAVAGMTELPAMALYSRVRRRLDCRVLLRVAAWAWVAKDALVLLARSPQAIYASALLQFFSFAVYVPATVDYIGQALEPEDFLKGQALSGSAFTLGSLLATFVGGALLDVMPVRGALALMLVAALGGAALFTAACSQTRRGAMAAS